jgi:hypothetical protein
MECHILNLLFLNLDLNVLRLVSLPKSISFIWTVICINWKLVSLINPVFVHIVCPTLIICYYFFSLVIYYIPAIAQQRRRLIVCCMGVHQVFKRLCGLWQGSLVSRRPIENMLGKDRLKEMAWWYDCLFKSFLCNPVHWNLRNSPLMILNCGSRVR